MELIRNKYFKIGFKSSFMAISNALNENAYGNKNPKGFELIETTKSKILSRYIEKTITNEEISDPFGNTEIITTTSYTIVMFEIEYISRGLAMLTIINSTAPLKAFIKKISNDVIDGFSIEKLKLNLEDFYQFLSKSKSIDRYAVNEVNISSLQLAKNATASIKIKSTDNAYTELKGKFKNKQYNLDKLSFLIRLNGNSETVTVSTSGGAVFTQGLEKIMREYAIKQLI